MARQPLGALAAKTFDRLGIPWRLGAAQHRYNERLTTQVPWRTTDVGPGYRVYYALREV